MPDPEGVADAGPLIHLDEADANEALHVFRRITVPTAIADEVRAQPRGPGTRLLRQRHVHVSAPSRDEQAVADAYTFRRLSGPDRVALAMAQARDAPLLTDDLDVRDAARSLEMTAVGSLGVILRAVTSKLLTKEDGRAAMDRLLAQSSIFLTKGLVEKAKAAL